MTVRRVLASPYALVIAIAVIVGVLPWFLPSNFYVRVATLVYINALAVLGLTHGRIGQRPCACILLVIGEGAQQHAAG